MKKLLLVAVVAGTMWAATASAHAARPANQACLGHDISGYAQGGSSFGGFIAGMAENTAGVGTEFQAHLAGQVPDSVIPNSCND